jgi:DEAD/DEAH box helicase domain-containing protein
VFGTDGIEPQDVRHFQPTVFLYDNYPGGIGLSTPLYDRRREVVQQAYSLVTACACLYGCPACVGPILAAGESDGPPPKEAARLVLSLLTGESSDGA